MDNPKTNKTTFKRSQNPPNAVCFKHDNKWESTVSVDSTSGGKCVTGNRFSDTGFLYDGKTIVVECLFAYFLIFHCACAVATIYLLLV